MCFVSITIMSTGEYHVLNLAANTSVFLCRAHHEVQNLSQIKADGSSAAHLQISNEEREQGVKVI